MKILQHTRIKKPLCSTRVAGRFVNAVALAKGAACGGKVRFWWGSLAGGTPDPCDIGGLGGHRYHKPAGPLDHEIIRKKGAFCRRSTVLWGQLAPQVEGPAPAARETSRNIC